MRTQKSLSVLKEIGVYIQHCLIGVHIGFCVLIHGFLVQGCVKNKNMFVVFDIKSKVCTM